MIQLFLIMNSCLINKKEKALIKFIDKEALLYLIEEIKKSNVNLFKSFISLSLYDFYRDNKISSYNKIEDFSISKIDSFINNDADILIFITSPNPLINSELINDLINNHKNSNKIITISNDILLVNKENICELKKYDDISKLFNVIDNNYNYIYYDKYIPYLKENINRIEAKLIKRIKEKFKDCFISSNSIISSDTIIGKNVRILGNCIIVGKCVIDDDSIIIDSYISNSNILNNVSVGPFSSIKNNSCIYSNCVIGNFVEIKNSIINSNTKIKHHAYIGDCIIGKNCNIGCGVITCNYNGKVKNKTIIGDNCFIGSNCNLIAPIKIGTNCYIGAGITLKEDVLDNKYIKLSKNYIVEDRLK